MSFRKSFVAATAAVVSISSVAGAATVVTDTFTRTVAGSFGTADLGGTYVNPAAQVSQSVDGSKGIFAASANTLPTNTIAGGATSLTVSYTGQRQAANGLIASFFGSSDGTTVNPGQVFDISTPARGADFGVLVQQSSTSGFVSRVVVYSAGVAVNTFESTLNTASNPFDLSYTVTAPSGFGAGQTGTLGVTLNGTPLGNSTVTFDGVNTGILTVSSNQANSTIDNLLVTTVVPEPTTLAGLAGMGLMALRRRRA